MEMELGNYWRRTANGRLNRRRLLAATGAAALGGSFLAACGGGSNKGSAGGDISSLVAKPQDTSKDARKGGTLLASRIQDAFTFDPHLGLAGSIGNTEVYSRLFKLKASYLKTGGWEFDGDMFESWEFSAEKLLLTAKVRPNFKWHNVAPVNGRQVDAQDIAFSWGRYESIGQNRGSFSAKANPDAPIESMTAVDDRTVRIKLNQPVGGLIGLFATTAAGMYFVPKEADTAFDPRNICIGSGNWMIGENKASVSLTFKRHEGHYDAGRMYLDERRDIILPEYASSLAQFQTGALHRFAVRQEDILGIKRQVPELQLYINQPPSNHGIYKWGWNPALGAKTPFRDKRLRQAFAMAIDRDLLMETIFNLSRFASEGVNLKSYLYSAVQTSPSGVYGGDEAFWLDPKSKDFGPNAKYYQYLSLNTSPSPRDLSTSRMPSSA
jgi:peptide/nickel transport system substrate-binding protein